MIFSPLPGIPVITQGFGGNHDHYKQYGLMGHNGFDLRCRIGTPVYAPAEGYLHYGDEGHIGYGKYVKITGLPYLNDGTRREVTLGHLSAFIYGMEGKYVAAGELVGFSGQSGDATGPHLHLTYKKLDKDGHELDYDNGFHGSIDVSQYIELWIKGNTLKPA